MNQEKDSGYIYPEIKIAIKTAINPLFNEIKKEVELWALSHKLFEGESGLQKLKREEVIKLGCYCCPESDFERTVLLCKYLIHVILLDDLISEGNVGEYYDSLLNYKNDRSKVIETMNSAENFPQNAITASFVDIWKQLKKLMDINWQTRFAESFIWYVKSCRWEVDNRKHGRIPQLGEYLMYRFYVSGVEPCLILVELTENIRLPDSVYLNPTLQKLITSATNIIAFDNDLHSFEKEKRDKDFHNLVDVIKHQYNISYQDAINKTADFVNAELHKYFIAEKLVPSFGNEVNETLQRFLQAVRHWIRGSHDWGIATGRYKHNI